MQFMAPDSEPSRISVMQGNSSKGGIKMGSSNLVHCVCVCWGVHSQESAVKDGFHLSLCVRGSFAHL